jgi:16S rRNA (cytosine1402-N4)-methyltransferase
MMDYHLPVLLEQCIEGLKIKPNGVYVDATFGGGGHANEILKQLGNGKLIAFDQDEDAEANVPDDRRVIFVHHNFRFLKNFLKYYGIKAIDGLLADLGVSSHHFDSPQRGFSFRFDSELDMRMNTKSGFSAKELVNSYPLEKLISVFRDYGELRNAKSLALAITQYRDKKPINSIRELLESICQCLPRYNENQYLAKVFQSLRIEVNREIDHLKALLVQTSELLKPGGRLAVISYHSLEDRVVKNYFRNGTFDQTTNKDMFGNVIRPLQPVNRKVIVPDEEEIRINIRARSARLRIAEKLKES